ncbi:MAG: universal stress protein [Candidatus Bathyarchaeia archaeon]
MFEKVLVLLDGSEHSERALETATQIAKKFGAKMTLLHVYSVTVPAVIAPEPTTLTPAGVPVVTSAEVAKIVEAARMVGNRILTEGEQKAKSANVRVETTLREGNTVQETVALAKEGEFDLIVMGARGISRIRELLMGSVSEGVIKNAHCPVLVVK